MADHSEPTPTTNTVPAAEAKVRLYDRHFNLMWSGTADELADELRRQAAALASNRRFSGHVSIDGTGQ